MIEAAVGAHSVKPEAALEMVESYFPTLPKIELHRRGPARPGWDAWGMVPLVLNEGKELGQWELEEVRGLLTVQSGVYSYMMEGGKIENKTRGFAAGTETKVVSVKIKLVSVFGTGTSTKFCL